MVDEAKKDTAKADAKASAASAPAPDTASDRTDHPTALEQTEQPGITGTAFTDAATPTDTVIGDPEGVITNRPDLQGTIQREPKPEALPSDAKIAPLAEQVNPNGAALAVGAAPQPDTIAGVEQPKEGEKNVLPDMSDASVLLPEDSEQGDAVDVATGDAERFADRGEKH